MKELAGTQNNNINNNNNRKKTCYVSQENVLCVTPILLQRKEREKRNYANSKVTGEFKVINETAPSYPGVKGIKCVTEHTALSNKYASGIHVPQNGLHLLQ